MTRDFVVVLHPNEVTMRAAVLLVITVVFSCAASPVERDEARDSGVEPSTDSGQLTDGGTAEDAGQGDTADAGEDPHGSLDGSVKGQSLEVRSVVGTMGTLDSSPPQNWVVVAFSDSDQTQFCADLESKTRRTERTMFLIQLMKADADGNPIDPSPGEYTVTEPGFTPSANESVAWAQFSGPSDDCHNNSSGVSGTVTLTTVESQLGGAVSGSFNIAFTVGRLKGEFDTSICASIPAMGSYTCE